MNQTKNLVSTCQVTPLLANNTAVELDVQVSMMTSVRKRELGSAFIYPSPAPASFGDPREIDPNLVAVQLRHPQETDQQFVFNMLISKEYAQKLGLMAGEKLKLKISKEV